MGDLRNAIYLVRSQLFHRLGHGRKSGSVTEVRLLTRFLIAPGLVAQADSDPSRGRHWQIVSEFSQAFLSSIFRAYITLIHHLAKTSTLHARTSRLRDHRARTKCMHQNPYARPGAD